jgi:hypothetical protein
MVQTAGRATVRRMPNQRFSRAHFRQTHLFRGFLPTIIVISISFLIGCDRNIEPYQPGEQPSQPDLARIFPGPPGGVESDQDLSNNARAPDRSALPPSRAEGSATSITTSAGPIEGRVELPDEAAGRPTSGVLFVIARPQGVQGGPPLAVLRIADPQFPLEFSIGPDNVMIPSMRFEGAISLSARLDADGNAMTRGAEDISSQVEEPLSPGTTGVKLLLTERG